MYWDKRIDRYVYIWEKIPGTDFYICEMESKDEDGNRQTKFIICYERDLEELDD